MTDELNTAGPSDHAAKTRRNQLIARMIVLAVIVAVAVLKPKVEAWLEQQSGGGSVVSQRDSSAGPSRRTSDGEADLDAADTDRAEDRDHVESVEVGVTETDGNDSEKTAAEANSEDLRHSNAAGNSPKTGSNSSQAKPSKKPSSQTASIDASPGLKPGEPPVTQTSPSDRKTANRQSGNPADKSSDFVADKENSRQPASQQRKTSKTAASSRASAENSTNRVDEGRSESKNPEDAEPPPGKLTLVRGTRDQFVSTAGLRYLSGSQDGHRLKHILQHAKDNPDKPVHGVFSGDRDQILAWIDLAYLKALKGGKGTRREDEGDRVAYTVDLGEKIGYVGGQVGERKNHPPCRYLKLVLQNRTEVVTAYPSEKL
ncbi:MAG: hypothetical protein KDA89_06355 [Planctomycetaceae bacterium]|nr:hypothetical protein [Planctomycetaceae bacterium]